MFKGDDTFNLQTQPWESSSRVGGRIRLDYRDARNGVDVDLGAGIARNDGFGDIDTININDATVYVFGSRFSDKIRGSDNDEGFYGVGGDDDIDGGGGGDFLGFVAGGRVGNLIVDMGEGTATGTMGGRAFSYTFRNIDTVSGGPGADILIDSERDDSLVGRGGGDQFVMAHGGHDVIDDFNDSDGDVIVLPDLAKDFGVTHADVIANAWQVTNDDLSIDFVIDLRSYGRGSIRFVGSYDINDLSVDDIRL